MGIYKKEKAWFLPSRSSQSKKGLKHTQVMCVIRDIPMGIRNKSFLLLEGSEKVSQSSCSFYEP